MKAYVTFLTVYHFFIFLKSSSCIYVAFFKGGGFGWFAAPDRVELFDRIKNALISADLEFKFKRFAKHNGSCIR